MGMAVAKAAVEVIVEEGMVENSKKMGEILADQLSKINTRVVKEVRGRGLFWAIEVHDKSLVTGNDLAKLLMNRGILTKATHENSVRLAPALVINEKEIMKAARKIYLGVMDLKKLNADRKK